MNSCLRLIASLIIIATCQLDLIAAELRVPEDFKTIQSAIDSSKPGDVVVVSSGTYQERLQLKPNLTVKSAGDDAPGKLGLKRAEDTVIDGGKKEGGDQPGVAMAEGSTLDGFTIMNVGNYDEDLWQHHFDTYGNEQKHEHIGHFDTPGIGIQAVTCRVIHNIVHHVGSTGIAIRGEKNKSCSPLISKNVCYRNMGGGIGSMGGSMATIQSNICFENFYAGIGHDNAHPLVINNDCYGNIRAGIGVSEGACPTVRNNKCYQNRRAGIGIRTGKETRPVIENNDCYENEMAGIGTDEEAAPVIRNNRCYKNKRAGIGSRAEASPTIIGNECYENGAAGIGQRENAHTVLIGNYCHHNKTAGIGFEACEHGKSTVINNRLIENAKVAVGVHAGWTVEFSKNVMERTGGLPPIVMVFTGSDVTFRKNVIRGSGVAGVRVSGKVTLDENSFEGQQLRKVGPPNFAVWALPGSEIKLTNNTISGWRHAISADGAKVTAIGNKVSDFWKFGFKIQNPKSPVIVLENQFISPENHAAISLPEDDAVKIIGLENNYVKRK